MLLMTHTCIIRSAEERADRAEAQRRAVDRRVAAVEAELAAVRYYSSDYFHLELHFLVIKGAPQRHIDIGSRYLLTITFTPQGHICIYIGYLSPNNYLHLKMTILLMVTTAAGPAWTRR